MSRSRLEVSVPVERASGSAVRPTAARARAAAPPRRSSPAATAASTARLQARHREPVCEPAVGTVVAVRGSGTPAAPLRLPSSSVPAAAGFAAPRRGAARPLAWWIGARVRDSDGEPRPPRPRDSQPLTDSERGSDRPPPAPAPTAITSTLSASSERDKLSDNRAGGERREAGAPLRPSVAAPRSVPLLPPSPRRRSPEGEAARGARRQRKTRGRVP